MIKFSILTVVLAVHFVSAPAHASEAELREAYTAYQVAAEEGDLRAALPHAQRAYELGLELYGPESRDTGLLAQNYAYILYDYTRFEQAVPIFEASLAALEDSERGDEVWFSSAAGYIRSMTGAAQYDEAIRFTHSARRHVNASSENGPAQSLELKLLRLDAMIRQVHHPVPQMNLWTGSYSSSGWWESNDLRRQRIRGQYFSDDDQNDIFRRAIDLLDDLQGDVALNSDNHDLQARFFFAKGRIENIQAEFQAAQQSLDFAIQAYAARGFVDDQMLEAYGERVWALFFLREEENAVDLISEAFGAALLRCNGGAVLLAPRLPNVRGSDFFGWTVFTFEITNGGQTTNIEFQEKSYMWGRTQESEDAIGLLIFAPARMACENISGTTGIISFIWQM